MVTELDIKKSFGLIVKELRTLKGLTQEKLAEHLDLQTQTITAIENGRTFISCEVLTKLSNYFEVEPSFFFSSKVRLITNEDLNYINNIKRILPDFSTNKLKEIYNILLVMQK